MISLKNISKSFSGKLIFDKANLEIPAEQSNIADVADPEEEKDKLN